MIILHPRPQGQHSCGVIALHMLTGFNPDFIMDCVRAYRRENPVNRRGFDCKLKDMDPDFEGIYHTEILDVLAMRGLIKRWTWLKKPMSYGRFDDVIGEDDSNERGCMLVHSDCHYAVWQNWMVWDTRNRGSFWSEFDLQADKVHGYIRFSVD